MQHIVFFLLSSFVLLASAQEAIIVSNPMEEELSQPVGEGGELKISGEQPVDAVRPKRFGPVLGALLQGIAYSGNRHQGGYYGIIIIFFYSTY